VTRGAAGTQFSLADFAPFSPYCEPEMPKTGVNQRLVFKSPSPLSVLVVPGGKRVRVDIVGKFASPIWAAIYTRTLAGATAEESACVPIRIDGALIAV
jgi:hypothetical protein